MALTYRNTHVGAALAYGDAAYNVPVIPAPTGIITLQPAPDGQSQRFVGTTANATSGSYTLTAGSTGTTIGPVSFATTGDAFDFTVDGIASGDYVPTLTVTGDGGIANVTGVSAFSIMGVAGGGGVQVVVDCLVGDAAATGAAAAVFNNASVVAAVGAAVASGLSAVVFNATIVTAGIGGAIASGLSSVVSNTATVLAGAGSAIASGLSSVVSNTATVLAGAGSAIASGLSSVVSNTAIINATIGDATAAGAAVTIGNTAPTVLVVSRAAGYAIAACPHATVVAGRGTIVVAPCRVLIGTGQNQPDIDGTYVMRGGRPTIDADADAALFYGADLTPDLDASGASVVSVLGIAHNVVAGMDAFIQGEMVVAKIAMIASDDPDAVYSFTFRFTNTLGEVNDRTIYLRKVEK